MTGYLHLSLHDVAPSHLERLQRAEALFAGLGVSRLSYLLVPDFHRCGRADLDPKFVAFCQQPRSFAIEWLLHGYYHREDRQPDTLGLASQESWRQYLARRWMTAGEGEFLAMTDQVARERLQQGIAVFTATVGHLPLGFVPPAWLYRASHHHILAESGIRFTEDHHHLFDLQRQHRLAARALTWATRTPVRKATSIVGLPWLARLEERRPLVRVAVHPHDFDHRATVASIRRLLSRLLTRRQMVTIAQSSELADAGWQR